MTRGLRTLVRLEGGSSAAEFAMVLPLLLIFIFGLIDAARFMWTCNLAEKATQMGVRYAVTTNMLPSDLYAYDFTKSGVVGGQAVPTSVFDSATCVSTGCTCTGSAGQCGFSSSDFAKIVDRMRLFYPKVAAADVQVVYKNVGLGYAGDPNGVNVSPLITVSLIDGGAARQFHPITLLVFSASIPLPAFSASLTMEDGSGTVAN